MRRGNEPSFIMDGDKVIGVNLSSDFTAEHEWGIKKLKQYFGIPEDISVYGMARRKITTVPKGLDWSTHDTRSGFCYANTWDDKPYDWSKNSELKSYKGGLCGAWSDSDFGAVAAVSDNNEDISKLLEIYNRFKALDIVITFGATKVPVFENPGLVIAIASRIPQDTIKMWEDSDREIHEVRKEFDASGIEKLLLKNGKRYFALSPWRDSDGSLVCWLNPMEQDRNNYGWFKIEDLKAWAEGKGKIPKESSK